MENAAPSTPLWPAGHLPLKGGDQPLPLLSPITDAAGDMPEQAAGEISPLEGEMPGRAEGGVAGHYNTEFSKERPSA
jgi:assimilatory nitrate reductase catalytic subunit